MSSEDYYEQPRWELQAFIPSAHRRVLEVGCASGQFSALLGRDAEVWGVEMHEPAAAIARTKLFRVHVGSFDAVAPQLPDAYFDLVVCNDVIEHMADDEGFLRRVQSKMAPGAHLMGSIPNMRHWRDLKKLIFRRQWEYADSGVLDRTHLRFYTVDSFRRTLERCGYKVERLEGINRTTGRGTVLALKLLGLGAFTDTAYMQYAFVACPRTEATSAR